MGIQPTYDLADRGDMMGGSWIWIILILLFAGRGFGNDQQGQDNFISSEFIKRDIFNTDQNVSAQGCATQKEVIESRYTTQLGLQGLQASQQACCCETQRAIDGVNAQSYKNTCEITTAIHAEGEATRALISAQAMQDLRDRLADRDRELMTANFQLSQQAQSDNIINSLIPRPVPAYPSCSPYVPYNGCGCNGFNV